MSDNNKKTFKPGDTVKFEDETFVVLDILDPIMPSDDKDLFLLSYNSIAKMSFGSTNNYTLSLLPSEIEAWTMRLRKKLKKNNIPTSVIRERTFDLTTALGEIAYGVQKRYAAPLTYDEFIKYRDYIPCFADRYWLSTAWDIAVHREHWKPVMYVRSDKVIDYANANQILPVKPALILNSKVFGGSSGETTVSSVTHSYEETLPTIPTSALLQELVRRNKETEGNK
jgi:hypothetical protein